MRCENNDEYKYKRIGEPETYWDASICREDFFLLDAETPAVLVAFRVPYAARVYRQQSLITDFCHESSCLLLLMHFSVNNSVL
jgi:hypothetical protein